MSRRGHSDPTKRVVMTGGGDFVGSHLLARMVGAELDVTLIGPDTGESRYTASLVSAGEVRFVRCDAEFLDDAALGTALEGARAVVLFGHQTAPPASVPDAILNEFKYNVAPLVRVLHAAEGVAQHVVFASSVAVYGDPVHVPVRESDAMVAAAPYAIAKVAAEQAVRATSSAGGMTVSILRFATAYGPGETARHPVGRLLRVALCGDPIVVDGDGLDEHDYVHVADVVDATLAALRTRADGTYNVGTGVGTTTADLARLITRLTHSTADPVFRTWSQRGQRRTRLVCDTLLASTDLGFTAQRALADGLAQEIGWLKAQSPGTTAEAVLAPSA